MKTNFFSKANLFTIKAVLIAILVLLMLIPVSMVKSIIFERQGNKIVVQQELSSIWGGRQHLTGPIMVLPYNVEKDGKTRVGYAYFLPDSFDVNGEIKPHERSRSIYKVLCYESQMHVSGKFNFPNYEKLNLKPEQIRWQDAFLVIGIPYLQGIKNQIVFNFDGKPQELMASVNENDLVDSGLTVKINLDPENAKNAYNFDFNLNLNGTEGLYFTPIGKQSKIKMKSDWKSVKFIGDFLPNEKATNSDGFDAQWDIFDYNRNYPQMWIGENKILDKSVLGVDLLQPIDQYEKTMRSVKYAVIFIALTFLVFFVVELLSRKRIHPIQYLLVSFALVLFYCLLLALSEHLRFGFAYLISAIAIVLLITMYTKSIFKNLKQTCMMGLFLAGLYVFLYVILQLEDMALLLGSIGLFIALAIVMYVSRKVDWYKKDKEITE